MSKVNHTKRLEVTGQGEILSCQDFDGGCWSTYNACVCDTPLYVSIRVGQQYSDTSSSRTLIPNLIAQTDSASV